MSDKILLASDKHIRKIQLFIQKNWRSNHILALNKKIFIWQHDSKSRKLNFIIALNKKNEVCGVLGLIVSGLKSKNIGAWLGIWQVNKSLCDSKSTGLELLKFVHKEFDFKFLAGTQLTKNVFHIYKFLGFKIEKTQHYFLPNKKKSVVFETNKKPQRDISSNPFNISEFKSNKLNEYLNILEKIIYKNVRKNFNFKSCLKDKDYLLHRYDKHPIYTYNLLTITELNELRSILITRKVRVRGRKILRIIDVLYLDLESKPKYFSDILTKFIKIKNFDYVDLVVGIDAAKIARKLNFYRRSNSDLLPYYLEPLKKENEDKFIGYKLLGSNKFYFFKGDSDSDRPNK
tara:strand:- start:19924 stop:20958 length:1035 start_codon:yes stop_codon:yes gene_type:complete